VIVLGIDAATLCTGWGVLIPASPQPTYVASGELRPDPDLEPKARIEVIWNGLSQVAGLHRPTRLYFEESFSRGRNSSYLGWLQGACQAAGFYVGAGVGSFSPKGWRKMMFGNGAATKHDAVDLVNARLGLDLDYTKHDEAEALCIAWAGIRGLS